MFSKILISNRGEIACRVIRTAKRLGIKTVAVYSEADAGALHMRMADEAIPIGPPPAAESYLKMDAILEAAKSSGAEAVHPGYGFLAENAAFAEMLAKAGIVFIGPPPKAIAQLGDKIQSKKIAQQAGVNVIPGLAEAVEDAERAAAAAKDIGYPVMIKAAAGGGGKGMRLAWSEDELDACVRSAINEAQASFGDGRVFVEKFIEEPRHIEIQVLADAQGRIIHLGERECSIQRRHQKVIEEAPSPLLDAATRNEMGAQACALAKAVGYVSAGTVEFVADQQKHFYFLEMNTRLQVEHPVTEFITGLDLVEQQIRIAAGEPLSLSQREVRLNGWAMECRLYAEDPARGFMPSIGRLKRHVPPVESESVRIDSGVEEGSEISMYYDPMIAKLITHGKNRDAAIATMRAALDTYYVRGISHNLSLLNAIMGHPRFRAARLSTAFLEEEYPEGFAGAPLDAEALGIVVPVSAVIHHRLAARAAQISGRLRETNSVVRRDWVVAVGEAHHPVRLSNGADGLDIAWDNRMIPVKSDWRPGLPLFRGTINGRAVAVQVDRDGPAMTLSWRGVEAAIVVYSPRAAELAARMPKKQAADLSRFLLSPMPGLVVSVTVSEGDEVKAGQPLAIVDAMKMENVLRAERDGRIAKVRAAKGDSLAVDQVILEFE